MSTLKTFTEAELRLSLIYGLHCLDQNPLANPPSLGEAVNRYTNDVSFCSRVSVLLYVVLHQSYRETPDFIEATNSLESAQRAAAEKLASIFPLLIEPFTPAEASKILSEHGLSHPGDGFIAEMMCPAGREDGQD